MRDLPSGGNAALTRENPHMTQLVISLAWDAGSDATLSDAIVPLTLLCDGTGRVTSQRSVVFHNQMLDDQLSVRDLEHALGSDQEQVVIDIERVPDEVSRIVFALIIDPSAGRNRHLGQLRGCRIRAVDDSRSAVLAQSVNLVGDLGRNTAAVLGWLYRDRRFWKLKVLGQGYVKGLAALADDFGVTW
ncbi:MAG: TerD family protein [Kineosporiaceae bacterium]|nr:TerD family protein [Kineosporiaceae bacterium]MBK7624431.1 TerD family protein [Kineosporiaceae bacterium]